MYAELAGAGITADSHDIAQPDPAGLGATRAMKIAMREAGLEPGDIATSTPTPPRRRRATWPRHWPSAVPSVSESDSIVVTSTKSMTGHLLGAAGALESVATVLAIHHRIVPPTINLEDPEDVGLDIADKPRELGEGPLAALNNSFGFGGHNVALAFRSV